jgi:hypothetical protein
MLLKTKDRCGKLSAEAGMFMKTQVLSSLMLECLTKQKELRLVTARGELEPVARTSVLEVRAFNSEWQLAENPFLNEQSWNVIENKGPLWETER